MSVYLSPVGNGQVFLTATGLPANNGYIYTYQAGTTTPAATYTTSLGNVANTYPIRLTPAGMAPAEIWLTGGQAYKFVVTDVFSNPIGVSPYDNLYGINDPQAGGQTLPATSVTYTPPGAGAVATTVGADLNNQHLWPLSRFGLALDGITDDTTKLQSALDSGENLTAGPGRPTILITGLVTATVANQVLDLNFATLNLNDGSGLLSHIQIGNNSVQLNGFRLRNGIFTRVQAATAGAAILARYCGVLEIERCRVYGQSRIYRGFDFSRVLIADLCRNYIQACVNHGIYLVGTGSGANLTEDVTIRNNRIEACGGDGLNVYDFVEGLFVKENIFYNMTGSGVACNSSILANGLVSAKFVENDFDTCAALGMYLQNAQNLTIAAGWFSNNTGANLQIDTGCTGTVVADNQLYGNASSYSIQDAGTDTVIGDNYLSGGKDGIHFKPQAAGYIVEGNVIKNMTTWGINLGEGPAYSPIGKNTFGNNTSGDVNGSGGPTVPSLTAADPLPVTGNSDCFTVTGNTNFGGISGGYAGRTISLIFTGTPTVFNAIGGLTTVSLQAGVNFTAAANNVLTIRHNGTQWFEMGRKT